MCAWHGSSATATLAWSCSMRGEAGKNFLVSFYRNVVNRLPPSDQESINPSYMYYWPSKSRQLKIWHLYSRFYDVLINSTWCPDFQISQWFCSLGLNLSRFVLNDGLLFSVVRHGSALVTLLIFPSALNIIKSKNIHVTIQQMVNWIDWWHFVTIKFLHMVGCHIQYSVGFGWTE